MNKRKNQEQITRSYHARIKNMLKGQTEREIFDSLAAGKNTYLRLDRLQSSSFDVSWIEMIENCIFDLGEIIANPRLNTKQVGNLVPVELARKTNAESVQHLASHTQYIKEIDEYGNVIPSKIMNIANEDDLHTYENRFIATLVRRLVLFIEKRYEFVSKFAELRNEEVLMFKNKSLVNGAIVEVETKVKVSYKNEDEMALKSNSYIERIAQMRDYILYFYNSPFMRQLKTERDVRNPILQTNIIRKNPKYHHCYEVYRFIETYDRLGVDYKVDENYSIFNEEELNELNHTLFANYITLRGKDMSKKRKTISHVYKPRILTSSDDEQFIYGPLLKGPIEFVRTDEAYQQYLDSKIRKDLPLHPTKKEKEYYADEYAEKAENRQDLKQKNDLLKRKAKELAKFEKQVQKILEEREQARLNLARLEREAIQKEENELLTAAREAIIAASKGDQEQSDKNTVKPITVTPMSHPYEAPVTYDEAVLAIWPQIKKYKPKKAKPQKEKPVVAPVKEPVKEEQPIAQEEIKSEAPIYKEPTPMSHPYSEPVTYDEATLQIWPQLANQPAKAKPVSKEEPQVVTKEVIVEKPVEVEKKVPVYVKPPKEMSHPASKPVTYEEATLEIWPQLANKPETVQAEPVKEEKPVKVKKASKAPKEVQVIEKKVPVYVEPPVAMSHPYSEPVTYEEATLQIWPQLANKPEPVKEQPVEVKKAPAREAPTKKAKKAAPVKEAPVVEKKVPVYVEPPVQMSHPYSEPVTYDEATLQIWPQLKEQPKPVKEEQPAPVKAKKAPVKKAAKKAEPATKEAPQEEAKPEVKKAAPKKAPAKKPAPKVEEPVAELSKEEKKPAKAKKAPKAVKPEEKVSEPAPEEKPLEAPKKAEEKKDKPSKKVNKPVLKKKEEKKAPVSKEKKPKNKPAPKKQPEVKREKIPGKFIVKTSRGYYVAKGKYSVYKDDAKVFDDFNLAHDIKVQQGGKVVKI